MKSIIITGSAGFIGSNLSSRLLSEGNIVYALDNFITSSPANTQSLKKNSNFHFLKHDITKILPRRFLAKVKKVDEIYHLACPTGVPNLTLLAEEMLLTCSIGTKNVLDLAVAHRAKLIFTSTSEIYGDPEIFPQSESYNGNVDPIGTRSPYEEGKRFSESLIAMYTKKYKLDTRIIRVFNTYGTKMTFSDTRVIPNFLHSIKKNKPITVHGEGLQKRTFCYIDDLIDGLILISQKGKSGEVYNLGSDEEITIADLAKKILSLIRKKSNIVTIERPSHDHKRRVPDLTKVYKLGWNRNYTLTDGLKSTIESLKL